MIIRFLQAVQVDTEEAEKFVDEIVSNTRDSITSLRNMTWPERWEAIGDWALHVGWVVLQVVLVVAIGRWLVKKLDWLIDRVFVRRGVDSSVNTFVRSMIRIVGWLLIIIIIINIVGAKTTSLAALIAAVGFAIGMALSGTLQNFAGGIMILLLKPFRTGDYIQAQGYEGTVSQIKLFSTIMRTSDNKTVIIPNGGLSTNIVNNFSSSGTRRVEWTFGISYGDDYDVAKQTLRELLDHDGRILDSPSYFIALRGLESDAVSIVVRAWVKTGDYWDVFFDMNEKVYKIFPLRGLNIPYNNTNFTIVGPGEGGRTEKAGAKSAAAEYGRQDGGAKSKTKAAGVPATGDKSAADTGAHAAAQKEAEEKRILTTTSEMKDCDSSMASMADSHDKLFNKDAGSE